ncbi:MAG TPA: nuclear transport factor 2 family protein [Rhizomicrobium sp.]|jgi:ketosteroid isomerase-like protein|nr:nuclear transport factor 2 family protein [Rhizomicrobium sp.]
MMRFALAAALLLAAAPAYASDETDIIAAITKMNDAMNKNDAKTAAAAYTANATIIDEFPPHYWNGANVFDSWNNDFAIVAKAQGDTDPLVTLAKPTHVSASGDHGYAVVPAVYNFKEHGRKKTEHGLWTFAMQKSGGEWKIAGWSWALR